MFAHRADAQAPLGVIEEKVGEDEHQEQNIDHRALVEKDRPDDRDAPQEGNGQGLKDRSRAVQGGIGVEEGPVEEIGDPQGKDEDSRAAHNLVDAVADAQQPMQRCQEHAREDAGQESDEGVMGQAGEENRGERPHQHHAFDANVDHTGTFRVDAAQRRQCDRRSRDDAADQHAGQVEGFIPGGPDEKCDHAQADHADQDGVGAPAEASDQLPETRQADQDARHQDGKPGGDDQVRGHDVHPAPLAGENECGDQPLRLDQEQDDGSCFDEQKHSDVHAPAAFRLRFFFCDRFLWHSHFLTIRSRLHWRVSFRAALSAGGRDCG